MCGFSGWLLNTETNADSIVSSLHAIKHRGPDDTLIVTGNTNASFYSCDLSNNYSKQVYPPIGKQLSKVCFGFNRLSIVDLSDNAMQPFYHKEDNTLFMMNGEVYNYAELKAEFLTDVTFNSASDAEVAFHLYNKLGNSFVEKLKGMFAIVLYNFNTNTVTVWRDRIGIKPFYYTHTEQGFMFSSEVKGIFAMQGIKKELNYTGLAYSMYLGTCPSPLTIYQNINSLQPGHTLEYNATTKKIKIQSYWHLKYKAEHGCIEPNIFNKDVEDICKLYATGQVKKAIMLSGGLDSGTLAYFYGKYDNTLEAVHLHSDILNSEYEYAQSNAKNAGITVQNFEVALDFSPAETDFFLSAEEEPNACPEPALVLCDKIKNQNIKVLYNALGPDEIFGGYRYYQKMNGLSKHSILLHLPNFVFPKKNRHKIKEIKHFGLASFPFIARQLFTWEEITDFLREKSIPIPTHPISFITNQILQLYPDFEKLPLLKKASYYDIFYYIASHHTYRCDQPSMRYGIEMRFPFLEHTFIEKYFNQSNTFNNIDNSLKPQYRNYIQSLLPHEVLTMKKQGFTIPIHKMLPQNENNESADKQWYRLMLNRISNTLK